jgi:hypothetical protein
MLQRHTNVVFYFLMETIINGEIVVKGEVSRNVNKKLNYNRK